MTEMGELGPGQDWDARAHVRLLRTNGGTSSGYTADLIERLYTELIAAAFASRPSQGGEWVMVPREPTRDQVEKLAQWWGYTVEEAAETYAVILDLTKDQSNG